jgi:xanthine dehydrogenase accessory factor
MRHISDDDVLDQMLAFRDQGTPFVVATVVRTEGHAPRKAGAKLLVGADGSLFGTVGGGAVESKVIDRAKALFAAPEVVHLAWDLSSPEAGSMICGGHMEFLLEPFLTRPRVFIFGGGHVGRALCQQLALLRFELTVIDDRDALMTAERFPGARLVVQTPDQAARELDIPSEAFCVIVNRSHAQDLDTLRGLVRRSVRYIGLMSSRRKRAELLGTLEREGVPAETLQRLHTPVGLAIGAETPEEIAVSIAAEMIAAVRGATPTLPG